MKVSKKQIIIDDNSGGKGMRKNDKIEKEMNKLMMKVILVIIMFVAIAIGSVALGLYRYTITGKDMLYFLVGDIPFIYFPECVILWYTGKYLITLERRKMVVVVNKWIKTQL